MKWKHWLVWCVLVVWLVGLGACADELREENAALRAMLKRTQTVIKDWEMDLDANNRAAILIFDDRVSLGLYVPTARWDVSAQEIWVCFEVGDNKAVMWCGYVKRARRVQ